MGHRNAAAHYEIMPPDCKFPRQRSTALRVGAASPPILGSGRASAECCWAGRYPQWISAQRLGLRPRLVLFWRSVWIFHRLSFSHQTARGVANGPIVPGVSGFGNSLVDFMWRC